MAEKKMLQKGKRVKDFKLTDQNGRDFRLTACKGKKSFPCSRVGWRRHHTKLGYGYA